MPNNLHPAKTFIGSRLDVGAAISTLYEDLDVPPPMPALPIAPLGPLLDRLGVARSETPSLTARQIESDLIRRRVIGPNGLGLSPNEVDERLSGFLYATNSAARLYVNGDDPVVRRRFSVAHELGHLILHFRPQLARWQTALDSDEDVQPSLYDAFSKAAGDRTNGESSLGSANDESSSLEEREQQADGFAATLLMPAPLVRTRADALLRDGVRGSMLTDRLAMELLVSHWAMQRRLVNLGIVITSPSGIIQRSAAA